MKVELIETKDGSHSLLRPDLNETYHSTHGAITESKYVFIEKGLKDYIDDLYDVSSNHPIKILEVGFGTGLNALLTCLYSNKKRIPIEYKSLETHPIDPEIVASLNYPLAIEGSESQKIFEALHQSSWNAQSQIGDFFILEKIEEALQQFAGKKDFFDLIYFDAFAPSKQPEMWEPSLFEKIYETMMRGGVLVTYCTQGKFKRDLKACGFEVEKLPGPPGKAEMTRAIKS